MGYFSERGLRTNLQTNILYLKSFIPVSNAPVRVNARCSVKCPVIFFQCKEWSRSLPDVEYLRGRVHN